MESIKEFQNDCNYSNFGFLLESRKEPILNEVNKANKRERLLRFSTLGVIVEDARPSILSVTKPPQVNLGTKHPFPR